MRQAESTQNALTMHHSMSTQGELHRVDVAMFPSIYVNFMFIYPLK